MCLCDAEEALSGVMVLKPGTSRRRGSRQESEMEGAEVASAGRACVFLDFELEMEGMETVL